FDDESNIKWDLGGNYPLLDETYGKIKKVDGRNGKKSAIGSYVSLNTDIFNDCNELTMSLWVKFTRYSGIDSKPIFNAGTSTSSNISLEFSPKQGTISVNISDGNQNSIASTDVWAYFQSAPDWMHIAFTYRNDNGSPVLSLYINGIMVDNVPTQVVLNNIGPEIPNFTSNFTDFYLDDIYITNYGLDDNKINDLYNSNIKDFMESEGGSLIDPIPDPGTDDPWDNEDPVDEIPGDNTDPTVTLPDDISPINFKWLAYTFDDTIELTRDLNGTLDSEINNFAVTAINTFNYGRITKDIGLSRRKAVYPESYINLPNGLLYDANSFTFSAWVYRENLADTTTVGNTALNTNITLNTLFEFTGLGKLVFSPFSTDIAGVDNAYVEAGSSLGLPQNYPLKNGKLKDINGYWVHFAFTFDSAGQILVYTNGNLSQEIDTGLKLSDLKLSKLSLITRSMQNDYGRIIIDDIYMASRALTDSEIRKINYYGVKKFVTEVLPDPNPDKTGNQTTPIEEEVDLRPDTTDEKEDDFTEVAIINGNIDTKFDNSELIGKDSNNAVTAYITNASLTQGLNGTYGLALDGSISYLRYPLQILDNVNELTISIAYNWNGHFTGTRTQKLFDFSYKNNSIDMPKRYMTLSMGNGTSGMDFKISDGVNTTTLNANVNTTNTWSRLTITIKDGVIKLFINGVETAKTSTNVNITSIKPNFNYVGKSGTKGDPLFKGIVDEIYISAQAILPDQIKGVEQVINQPEENDSFDTGSGIWDDIIKGVLIATVALVLIIIIVIVITIIKK
ncbi:MAG: hypothetical protein K0S55_1751, partial [Clostridia bacterium]|nr:hypothetical protein [Clostridia bacterium]